MDRKLSMKFSRVLNKKVYDYTVMIVGSRGSGKDSLLKSLFPIESMGESDWTTSTFDLEKETGNEVQMIATKYVLEFVKKKQKCRLNVIIINGVGDAIDSNNCWNSVRKYIEKQFNSYLEDESGFDRQNIIDKRVHCLIYLIQAGKNRMDVVDVSFLKNIQETVNIIPILAKADMLTSEELSKTKNNVKKQLMDNYINVYEFPVFDLEMEETFSSVNEKLKKSFPLAICLAGKNSSKNVEKRVYNWGFIDVTNSQFFETDLLKEMITETHIEDLKAVTEELHYEKFRARKLGHEIV